MVVLVTYCDGLHSLSLKMGLYLGIQIQQNKTVEYTRVRQKDPTSSPGLSHSDLSQSERPEAELLTVSQTRSDFNHRGLQVNKTTSALVRCQTTQTGYGRYSGSAAGYI